MNLGLIEEGSYRCTVDSTKPVPKEEDTRCKKKFKGIKKSITFKVHIINYYVF